MTSIQSPQPAIRIAIQGEPGSNSHRAALSLFGASLHLVPCASSLEVFEALAGGTATQAVLPIENSLHGAVFEHYDLLLDNPVHITAELLLRIRHNVIAAPGTTLADIRHIGSHPVALSQCRLWLRAHPGIQVTPAYDTAGSVKQLMAAHSQDETSKDTAGIAPALAAQVYGAQILVEGIEDQAENYTRFYVLAPGEATPPWPSQTLQGDKMSVALKLVHRPGTLLAVLQVFAKAGVNLTKIESRPVPGRPWEYVFFIDVSFDHGDSIANILDALAEATLMVRILGIYPTAPAVL